MCLGCLGRGSEREVRNQPAEYGGAELEGRFGGLWGGGVWKIGKRGCSGETETKNGVKKPK